MSRGVPSISADRAAKGRGHGREEIDRAGAGERRRGPSCRQSSPVGTPRRSKPRSRSFYLSVADIFERWVTRRLSMHTQRAYRQDVMDFVRFLGLRWPDESTRLFTVSVADVLAFRDQMLAESKAPKTINRRIACAVLVLQVPPGRRLRVSAAHHGPESGTRPVHPPGLVRPARRDQGPLGDPCPAAHGAPLRRHGVRLPGPGHHQVLPL